MQKKIRTLIQQQWAGLIALFLVLSGGTALASHETIFSDDIVDEEVKAADIDNSAVRTFEILNGTVLGLDIADNTITSADLQNGQVRSADVRNDDLRSEDILDGTIGNVDVAFNTLLGDVIRDGTLTGQDVAPDSLTGTEIQESSLQEVPQADNADNLGGLPAIGYHRGCDSGTVRGFARVAGHSLFPAGFTNILGSYNCAGGAVQARRVAEGRYRVRFVGGNPSMLAVGSVDPDSNSGSGTDDFVSISHVIETNVEAFAVSVRDADGGFEDATFTLLAF